MELKFRTPHCCQNGHFRWLYWQPNSSGFTNTVEWGEKTCDCPTGNFGEGFHAIGLHEQYIGLSDKNEKEIYVGDILKDNKDENNPIGVVYFYPPQFVVQTLDEIPFALAEGKVNMKQLAYTEIIGNIFANPELLKA